MIGFDMPVAFHFSVMFTGLARPIPDTAFQEVSGLDTSIEVEKVVEGGENRFVHQLPKPVTHGNLKLKRGLTSRASMLVQWCKDTIENDFSKPIDTMGLLVNLLDERGNPVAAWSVENAYPVKWSVGPFDAMKNELAIETIELAYSTVQRKL